MADVKPTPTQAENDLAAQGQHVMLKESDGSDVDNEAMPSEQRVEKKQMEAKPPPAAGGYQTRQARPAARPVAAERE